MDTTTLNRRQQIDAAEAALDRAAMDQAAAEKRKMRAMQELTDADARLTDTTRSVDGARVALMEALAYVDPPRQLPEASAPATQLDLTRDHFAPAGNGAAASVDG